MVDDLSTEDINDTMNRLMINDNSIKSMSRAVSCIVSFYFIYVYNDFNFKKLAKFI